MVLISKKKASGNGLMKQQFLRLFKTIIGPLVTLIMPMEEHNIAWLNIFVEVRGQETPELIGFGMMGSVTQRNSSYM